jgi:RNA polymerase sigma-70 factor (ECF subfamily)
MPSPGMTDAPTSTASDADLALVEALRAGDETAFMMLVDRLQPAMLRIARMYVSTRAVAEEVVQETWLGVLKGLDAFEGRSSLRTWIFRILTNVAKTRGQRESRSAPFSSVWATEGDEPAVDLDRFFPEGHRYSGGWVRFPEPWETQPEANLLSHETLARVGEAISALPPNQREVIRLRDVLGWSSSEVCNALEISETNQRVLLHRARAKVRRALEGYLTEGSSSEAVAQGLEGSSSEAVAQELEGSSSDRAALPGEGADG